MRLKLGTGSTGRRFNFYVSDKHIMIGIASDNPPELVNPEMIISKNIINAERGGYG